MPNLLSPRPPTDAWLKQMSGVIIYETHGDWGSSPGGGNFQIHMPNNGHPYTASSVPAWILPLEN